jgi:hypothetical protein
MAVRKLVLAMLVVLVGACCARAAEASTRPISIEDLATRADVIVIADVADVRSHWNATRTMILTTIDLGVREAFKGAASNVHLTVTELGGTVDNIASVVPDAPRFRPGERALLFLSCRPDGGLGVTHLWQGKFDIEADAGNPRAVRRLAGSDTVVDAIPLTTARAAIRAHATPGAAPCR